MSNSSEQIENKYKSNIWAISLVSFFMNLSASLITSSANNFLLSEMNVSLVFLGMVRGAAEGLGHAFKVTSGILSDILHNRRIFLIVGYGGMILLKPLFALTTFDFFGLTARKSLYASTHFIDRILNASRDSVRDAAVAESSENQKRGQAFGMRKFLSCLGSTTGGVLTFLIFLKFGVRRSIFQILFSTAVIPSTISVLILIFCFKDVFKETYKQEDKFHEEELINKYQTKYIMPKHNFLILFFSFLIPMLLTLIAIKIGVISKHIIDFRLIKPLTFGIPISLAIEVIFVQFFLSKFTIFLRDMFKKINIFLFTIAGIFMGRNLLYFHLNMTEVLISFIIIGSVLFLRLTFLSLYHRSQKKIEYYQKEIKSFNKILLVGFIMSFGKYSDVFVFKHMIDTLRVDPLYTPLIFSGFYLFFGIFSYILAKLSDKMKRRHVFYIAPVSLFFFNLMMTYLYHFSYTTQLIMCPIILAAYSIHMGSIECSFTSAITKIIKINAMKGTMLGLYNLFVSLGNSSAAYLISNVYPSIQTSYQIAMIPSILGFILLLMFSKVLDKDTF